MDSECASDDDSSAMAELMGFSGFGTQGPAKKRKFNPYTDATIDGQDLEKIDKGGKKGQGSGGNDVPLGKQRVFGQHDSATRTNEEEIDLENDIENEENGNLALQSEDGRLDGSPRYIDTSMPAPADLHLRPVQDRGNEKSAGVSRYDQDVDMTRNEINDIIVAGEQNLTQTACTPPAKSLRGNPTSKAPQGLAQYMSALHGASLTNPALISSDPAILSSERMSHTLPNRPHHSSQFSHVSSLNNVQHNQSHKPHMNKVWYLDYYDPNFNENPWAQLEKSNGLQPRGTWLERERRP